MLKIVMKELLSSHIDRILKTIKEASKEADQDFIDNASLQSKIYEFLDGITPTETRVYDARVRNAIKDAKNLEKQSFSFLISAEYISDTLVKQMSDDFSPYILQMSRAVESELLLKLFIPYTNFIRTQDLHTEITYEYDLNNQKTRHFANMVTGNRTTYTLGNMCHILTIISDHFLIERSQLIKDFQDYIDENFSSELYSKDFVSDLTDLSRKYRNKSAHTTLLSRDKAADCKFLVKKILNRFLDVIR